MKSNARQALGIMGALAASMMQPMAIAANESRFRRSGNDWDGRQRQKSKQIKKRRVRSAMAKASRRRNR